MALTYGLHPNKMLKGESVYRALIKNRRQYMFDQVIDRVAIRNRHVSKAEIKGIVEQFMEEVSDILEKEGSVITPLFQARCSIAGLFDGPGDSFSRERHQVKVKLKPGSLLKKMAGQARPRKAESSIPQPLVIQFKDMTTGEDNSVLTPGGPVIIKGARLKFDPDDPEQGVFFVNEAWQHFRVPGVLQNTFSRVVLVVPKDLEAGTYQLQVKSTLKTRTVRTGKLNYSLVVG